MACLKDEKEALLKLKASFIDPSKRLASWRGEDCCKWDGVFCNKNSGHVIKLDLQNPVNFSTSLLTNEVDSSLLELKYLNYLDLSGNYFNYTQIPSFIGSMVELRFLNLSHAWFYGRVPRLIGNLTNLVHLDINNDKFSYGGDDFFNRRMLFIDDIEWISSLESLESLDLSGVNLEEALNLMHVIKNLPSLLSLKLRLCNLQRIHLSHAFSNASFLSRIRVLDLSYNMFDSAIPEAFQNMTSLRFLYLSNNHFTSSIPLWFQNLQNLVVVSLESNLFTSVEVGLSSTVRSNCHLKVFDLSDNGFLQGDVFGIHGNLSFGCNEYDLEVLDLENTTFGASRIPDWLGQLKNLKYLNLKNTSLYGLIPDSFGNLSSIETIDVYKNMLSGGIPSSFGKQLNLKRLRLDNNKLDGVIDNSFGQLQSLEMLDISKNSFKGVVSEIHFVNLSRLFILNMDRNSLLSFNVKPNWVPPFQLKFLSMRSCKGKRILRYVLGTSDHGIHYKKASKSVLVGYCDSDWGGNVDDNKSTSGYVFNIGSGVFSWASKKQPIVALSTTEAEYISLAVAGCQVLWLRWMLKELRCPQEKETILLCDNSSAIALSKNPVFHGRSKHISIKYHFIRDLVKDGEVTVTYCKTQDQMADIFTKALKFDLFVNIRKMLGVAQV